jgi:CubicO group peptidase (beta-lactamase class C family)
MYLNSLLDSLLDLLLDSLWRLTPSMKNLSLYSVLFIVLATPVTSLNAQEKIDLQKVENTVERALEAFHTPGMGVGIVHKNEVLLAKGFGMANLISEQKVDAQTYFRLASTSKAFTSAAVAVLVDQGKLNWDDKVVKHLPEFMLYDPYVTREFTVLDLLSHKSGLLSGAGDSMIWPEPSGFTRAEVIHNLRYLTPEYSFRARYAYSNVFYITAGELVAKLSGMSFEAFVEKHIFLPLNMDCFVGDMPKSKLNNVAMSYGHNDERNIYPIPRNAVTEKGQMSAAAGGMVCNVDGMLNWVQALLNKQDLPFSEAQLNTMWQPQTILGISSIEQEWDDTFFKSYGLGWRLANIGNLRMVSHTGTVSGYQAYVVLIPKLELGVVLLNNGSNSAARGSVMQTIVKAIIKSQAPQQLTNEQFDWVDKYINYLDEREEAYLARLDPPVASAPMSISNDQVIGEYQDKWFGSFIVNTSQNNANVLRIHSSRMKTLTGTLIPFQDATYKIEWDNKNAASDDFMHFSLNVKREVVGAQLRPFTNSEVINHAYRDMNFVRVLED